MLDSLQFVFPAGAGVSHYQGGKYGYSTYRVGCSRAGDAGMVDGFDKKELSKWPRYSDKKTRGKHFRRLKILHLINPH